jgi:glycosyltransferase involved in cell wall biosynthesis
MKIAYVADIRLPTEKAHGLQIMEMCQAFARNGHDVCLVVPRRTNPLQATPWEYYKMEPSFKIVQVPILDFIWHDRFFGRFALWLNLPQFWLKASRVVRQFGPDVVYTRDPWFVGIDARARSVFEAHNFPERVTRFHRWLWKRASRVVAVTEGLRRAFVSAGVPETSVKTAHDGVDAAKFEVKETKAEARAKLGLPERAFIAVYTGHLYPYKGADDLLEACAHVQPSTRVLFVGGRPDDLARLETRAQALGLTNVTFTGMVPHAQVPLYLRAADAAVLPTRASGRHAAEFLSPLKWFDNLSAGKAIIDTSTPTVREVLSERSVVFVSPSDPTALARALSTLAESPVKKEELEREALALAEGCSWTHRAMVVLQDLPESKRSEAWYERYRVEIAVACLAFAIRVLYVAYFPQLKIDGGDGPAYLGLSDYVRGLVDAVPKEDLRFFSVGYPYLLAAIRSLFGNDLLWIRLVQAALSSATVFIGALAARTWLGRKEGLLAGVLLAVYTPSVLESGILYTETLYTFLLTSAIVCAVFAVQRRQLHNALVAGVGFMLAGLTREFGFYQAVVFGAWALVSKRSWKLALLLVLPTLLAFGGISLRNASIAKKHALTQAPLVAKNYEQALFEPTLVEFLFAPSRWHLYVEGTYLYWRFPHRLSDVGAGEPIEGRTNPGGDVVYHLSLKPGYFMAAQPLRQVLVKMFLVLTHWFILFLALVGLWRGKLPREAKIGFMLAILFAFATMMFGGLHRLQAFEGFEPLARYRFPTEPLILILAVAGAQALGRGSKR